MKLQLIARPGYAPTAVIMPLDAQRDRLARHFDRLRLAHRLLGGSANYDELLSVRWKCEVFCAPSFGRWWRTQDSAPPADYRIFLETLKA